MTRAAAALLALVCLWAAPAAASEVVDVRLVVDVAGGVATGTATDPDGRTRDIRIQRPTLADASNPFDGYIGPDGALLPADSGWLPDLPPGADAWRIEVRTSDGFVAVPYPGGDVAPDGLTTFVLPERAARAPLLVGAFRTAERNVGDVLIRTFFTDRNAGLSDVYLDAAGEAVASLAARIGAYPYEAFSVVESPLPVGLGYPGFTLVSGRILPLPFMRGRSLWHEIAHVWWGNGVFVDYEKGNWAEGFATFFADYALAERESPEAAREMRYDWLLEFDALPVRADIPLGRFVTKTHGQAQAVGYGKPAMLLIMLRDRIGEAAFDAGVRRFWSDNKWSRADWSDVQAAFQAETSEDLAPFFQRWLDEPGAAPPDPADSDFRTFRRLAKAEQLPTLRLAISAEALALRLVDGAPGSEEEIAAALRPLGAVASDGFPVLVGGGEALAARLDAAPEGAGPAIWAARLETGERALAVRAASLDEVNALAGRARRYGRWSWLTLGQDGRPETGRWPHAMVSKE